VSLDNSSAAESNWIYDICECSKGEIGTVNQVLASTDAVRRHLLVKAGLLGDEEPYVPESAIQRVGWSGKVRYC
jgi:hypothetical protein